MLNRGNQLRYNENPKDPQWLLAQSGAAEFFTYFNALSVAKWRKYTMADTFCLHLRITGRFTVQCFGRWLEPNDERPTPSGKSVVDVLQDIQSLDVGDIAKKRFSHETVREANLMKEISEPELFDTTKSQDDGEPQEICIPIQFERASVVAFEIRAKTPCTLYEAWYSAHCDAKKLNLVNISLCTTTFKKERYISRTVSAIRDEILDSGHRGGLNDLGDHLFINIVDNGGTLKTDEFSGPRMRCFNNPNTGGAGGFTRGMIETLSEIDRGEFQATHVLFMDDDVRVLPESLKRTYALLQLLKPEFRDRFISGAMLDIDQMNEQFEDLGFVSSQLGSYTPVKPKHYLHLADEVLRNEVEYPFSDMYAAWWYCCVPIRYVTPDTLSVPIFYRGDDIEFSLRNDPGFITLGGICVWHMGFSAKQNPALEYYLVLRNALVTQALSDVAPGVDYVGRIEKLFREEIRRFSYVSAEFLLDALDDYLKGPEFLSTLDGEALLRQHARKTEKMYPYSKYARLFGTRFKPDTAHEWIALNDDDFELYDRTDNGHLLPDSLLRDDDIPAVGHIFFSSPGKEFLRRQLIAVDSANATAILHTMDRGRYQQLIARHDELMSRYASENSSILARYQRASPSLHSRNFWAKALKLK